MKILLIFLLTSSVALHADKDDYPKEWPPEIKAFHDKAFDIADDYDQLVDDYNQLVDDYNQLLRCVFKKDDDINVYWECRVKLSEEFCRGKLHASDISFRICIKPVIAPDTATDQFIE